MVTATVDSYHATDDSANNKQTAEHFMIGGDRTEVAPRIVLNDSDRARLYSLPAAIFVDDIGATPRCGHDRSTGTNIDRSRDPDVTVACVDGNFILDDLDHCCLRLRGEISAPPIRTTACNKLRMLYPATNTGNASCVARAAQFQQLVLIRFRAPMKLLDHIQCAS